jgi:hypothetical protein
MKKLFPFVLAIASVAVIPTSAHAIVSNVGYDITIAIRDRGQSVGQLEFQAVEVSEDGADLDDVGFEDDLDSCLYAVKWTNDADLPSRTNLTMHELATVGYADCEENAEENFDTLIFTDASETNNGFNRQQQKRALNSMVLGEFEDGTLAGVVQFCDGTLYSVHAEQDP